MKILARHHARLLLPLLLTFASCDGQKQTSPEVRLAQVEAKAANEEGSERRGEVITAGREYLARTFPDWKINGVSTWHSSENLYFVFADISKGEERRTVNVSVKLFVEDDGGAYWKAEHSPDEGEPKVPGYAIRPYEQ